MRNLILWYCLAAAGLQTPRARGQAVDPDDRISTAQAVIIETRTQARMDQGFTDPSDVDMFAVTVQGGQKLGFDIDLPSGSMLDPYLRLFDGEGTELDADNDGEDGQAPGEPPGGLMNREAYLIHTFGDPGTYYLGMSIQPNTSYNPVTGTGDVVTSLTGDYSLRVSNLGWGSRVGYWPAEGDATDASGNGHDGVLMGGAVIGAGKIGQSFHLDGMDDYVATTVSIDQSSLSPGATFMAWVYPTSASAGRYMVISTDNGMFDWSLGRIGDRWAIFGSEPTGRLATEFEVELNRWQHVAAVFDAGDGVVRLFKNGAPSTNQPAVRFSTSNNPVTIGRNPGFEGKNFAGHIDEARVWRRALAGREILAWANGLIGYWSGDGHAVDLSGQGNDGEPSSGAAYGPGHSGQAFALDGVNDYIQVGDRASLLACDALTLAAWIYPTGPGSASPGGGMIASKEGEYHLARSAAGGIRFTLANATPGWDLIDTGIMIPEETWAHIALVYGQGSMSVFRDGVLAYSTNGSGFIADVRPNRNDFRIGGRQQPTLVRHFEGSIDEVMLFNRALTAPELSMLPAGPPVEYGPILTDPSLPPDTNAVPGTAVTLRVQAEGSPSPTYQWHAGTTSFAPVPEATNATYAIANLQSGDAGYYFCQVSGWNGWAYSRTNLVNFENGPVLISSHPEDQGVTTGASATLCTRADGDAPIYYQWRKNGVNMAGETNRCLEIANVQASDAGSYEVVVFNEARAALSDPALLTVLDVISVFAEDDFNNRFNLPTQASGVRQGHNRGATREIGEPLHAGKPGSNSVWFAWFTLVDGVATFTTRGSAFDSLLAVYTGSALATLSEVASDDEEGGDHTSRVQFNAKADTEYVVAVDGFAGANGDFTLDWKFEAGETVPVITNQTPSQAVLEGSDVVFAVETSDASLSFQWFKEGALLAGETSATLSLTAVGVAEVGHYTAWVTNSFGQMACSGPMSLEIGPNPAVLSRNRRTDLPGAGGAPSGASALDGGGHGGGGTGLGAFSVSAGSLGRHVYSNWESDADLGELHCEAPGGASDWIQFEVVGASNKVCILHTLDDDTTVKDTVLAVYRLTNDPDVAVACGTNLVRWTNLADRAVYSVPVDGLRAAMGRVALHWSIGWGEWAAWAVGSNVLVELSQPLEPVTALTDPANYHIETTPEEMPADPNRVPVTRVDVLDNLTNLVLTTAVRLNATRPHRLRFVPAAASFNPLPFIRDRVYPSRSNGVVRLNWDEPWTLLEGDHPRGAVFPVVTRESTFVIEPGPLTAQRRYFKLRWPAPAMMLPAR